MCHTHSGSADSGSMSHGMKKWLGQAADQEPWSPFRLGKETRDAPGLGQLEGLAKKKEEGQGRKGRTLQQVKR